MRAREASANVMTREIIEDLIRGKSQEPGINFWKPSLNLQIFFFMNVIKAFAETRALDIVCIPISVLEVNQKNSSAFSLG